MALDWGDTAQLAEDSARSKIAGKVGYFVLPGTTRVWDGRLWRWEQRDSVHKAPFLAFGGCERQPQSPPGLVSVAGGEVALLLILRISDSQRMVESVDRGLGSSLSSIA